MPTPIIGQLSINSNRRALNESRRLPPLPGQQLPKSETPELGISATCQEIRTVGGSMGGMIETEVRPCNDVYVYFLVFFMLDLAEWTSEKK